MSELSQELQEFALLLQINQVSHMIPVGERAEGIVEDQRLTWIGMNSAIGHAYWDEEETLFEMAMGFGLYAISYRATTNWPKNYGFWKADRRHTLVNSLYSQLLEVWRPFEEWIDD